MHQDNINSKQARQSNYLTFTTRSDYVIQRFNFEWRGIMEQYILASTQIYLTEAREIHLLHLTFKYLDPIPC